MFKMTADGTLKPIFFLSFLTSYKCTNECKHCALQASPNQVEASMELEDVRRYLEDITSSYNIQEVGFFGGEPLLNLNLIVSLIEEVKKFGISKIGLPTNGFWGKNDSTAKEYAEKLKEAGLYRIGFSADAFHQEFISLDVVRRAIRAAREAGIEWIGLVANSLGSIDKKNPFNDQTRDIIDVLSKEFEFLEVVNNVLQVKGRAATQLAQHYPMNTIPSEKCLIFKAPMFMIDPNGWVFHQSCQGICIGNAKKKPLSEIIGEFNYRKHPIIGKVVARGGPKNLLDIAIEKRYKPQGGYADNCHACFAIRNFLRLFYPDILEPSNLYY